MAAAFRHRQRRWEEAVSDLVGCFPTQTSKWIHLPQFSGVKHQKIYIKNTTYRYILFIFVADVMSLFNVNLQLIRFTPHTIISKSPYLPHSQTLKRRGISCGAKISSELEPSSILLRPSGLVVNIASREVPALAGSSTTL